MAPTQLPYCLLCKHGPLLISPHWPWHAHSHEADHHGAKYYTLSPPGHSFRVQLLVDIISSRRSQMIIDNRVLEPDEQWKADLRKRIEHDILHMAKEAQIVRDTILSSQPSERSRKLAERNYEESMDCIRTLAQDEFTRMFRQEMLERKRAFYAADFTPFDAPDAPQNAEGSLFTSPQDLFEQEPLTDESSEDGYGTGGLEDEDDRYDGFGESDDDGDEGDLRPRQRSLSLPSFSLTEPLHSMSLVSQRHAPSSQRPKPNFEPAEDNGDDDADDPHRHSIWSSGRAPHRQIPGTPLRSILRAPKPPGISRTFAHTNGQEYSSTDRIQFPRRSTGSTSSGSRLHRAGSMSSDQYYSRGVAPHGDTERPFTQNRYRIASSIAPRGRQTSALANPHDRPSPPSYPTPTRATTGARHSFDEAVRSPMSASPSCAIYGLQRSLSQTTLEKEPVMTRSVTSWGSLNSSRSSSESIQTPLEEEPGWTSRATLNSHRSFGDLNQTTPEEGPRGTSWCSTNSLPSFGEFNVHRRHNNKGDLRLPPVEGDLSDLSDGLVGDFDDEQSLRSMRSVSSAKSIERLTAWLENDAQRKEKEATRKEEGVKRREEEARRFEEKARQSLEEAKRLESDAQQVEASVKIREAAARKKEAKVRRKEAAVKKREADAQKREAEAQRQEENVRYRELEVRLKEEQARWKEEAAQRKEDEARKREEEVLRKEEEATRREDEACRKEEEATRREDVACRKEEEARRLEEKARQSLEEANRIEAGARQSETSAEMREADVENEEVEAKRDEIQVNFLGEASDFSKD